MWAAVIGAAPACAPTLVAQERPPASPADSAPPPPQAIPIDSIPARARDDATRLNALRDRRPADSVLVRTDATLAAIQTDYDARLAGAVPERLAALFYEDLADLSTSWAALHRRLDDWTRSTTDLTGRLEAAMDTVVAIRQRWQATRTAGWGDVPRAMREQVLGMLALADSATRALRPARERLLAAQGDAAQLDVAVRARRDEIDQAQARAQREIFRQDSPVLWRAFGAAPDSAVADSVPSDSAAAAGAPDKVEQARAYLAERAGRVRLHLGLFLVLVGAFAFARSRRDYWATAEFAMHWPTNLLAHPIAAAWLLALAASRAIYVGAPQVVLSFAFLLMVPAFVILLRELLGHPLRTPAFILLGLFAVRTVADSLSWQPSTARLALLALTALGIAAYVWFARLIEVTARTQAHPLWGPGRVLAYVAAGVLGFALVANVFGFVNLSALVSGATVASGLAALGLIALSELVIGVLLVLSFATPVGRLQVVRRDRLGVTRRIRQFVHAAAGLFWLSVVLRQFRVLDPTFDALQAFFTASITLGSWEFTIGEIGVFLVTLAAAVYIARGLRAVLREDVLVRLGAARGVPEAVSSIVYYVALAAGIVFAAGAAGIEFGRLALIAGALGLGIGFGLQTIVANFISGLILLFERPIQVGDTLELEGLRGEVRRIGIRASTVRTFQGAEVIVPNQDLIARQVINWTLSDQVRRVEVPIGVAYGSDPRQVMAILREAAEAHPKVLSSPAPDVLFLQYGESSLDFELRFWAGLNEWLHVRSDLLVTVYAAFAEHGIEIPFPQRDLHVRSVDRDVSALVDRRPS